MPASANTDPECSAGLETTPACTERWTRVHRLGQLPAVPAVPPNPSCVDTWSDPSSLVVACCLTPRAWDVIRTQLDPKQGRGLPAWGFSGPRCSEDPGVERTVRGQKHEPGLGCPRSSSTQEDGDEDRM